MRKQASTILSVAVALCTGAAPLLAQGTEEPDPFPSLRVGAFAEDHAEAASRESWLFTTPDADSDRLWSQTKLLLWVMVAGAGILYAMPESMTGWDQDVKITELPRRWWKNVSRCPEWDDNHWFYNYIGHPYVGGVYYQMARKSGYNQRDSFVYTTLMSTFYWEYGVEAFAERPSIQDLIVTPLAGWVYGEWAFRREKSIRANDNRVLGSRWLGGISLFFLDPIDHFGDWINRLVGREWVLTGSVVVLPAENGTSMNRLPDRPGVLLALERSF